MGEDDLKWVPFEPGEEPAALTTNLCALYGCDQCPGWAKVQDIPNAAMRDADALPTDLETPVFCTHDCHRVPKFIHN